MTMAASQYLESGVLNHLFRSSAFGQPTTIAIALTTDIPDESQTGVTINEVANAGAYARVDIGAPTDGDWSFMDQVNGSGHVDNVSIITFPTATANWGYASGVAIIDNATYGAGNLLFHSALDNARDIENNDTFSFPANGLDIYLS
jgi:hypothetical protein